MPPNWKRSTRFLEERTCSIASGHLNLFHVLNWYPGYFEAYQTLRREFESVLTLIEKTEKEKMGKSLPGTKADFKIVRAVLVGIRKKYLIFQEKLEQRRVQFVENSTAFKFNDILKEVRELASITTMKRCENCMQTSSRQDWSQSIRALVAVKMPDP